MKTNLLILSMLILGTLTSCSGSGDKKSTSASGNVITFTTAKEVGETINLTINADEADQADVWIDLNNNGKKDDGEAVTEFGREGHVETLFTLGAQTVSLYGNVTQLTNVDNKLTALDVSGNPLLTVLNCISNEITSLNVSKNTALVELACRSNKITSLDVSKNQLLEEVLCGGSELTKLTLSNPVLERIDANYSQLTALDVSGCPVLEELRIQENQFSKESLEALFNTLPDRASKEYEGKVKIYDNPGTDEADTSVAEGKKWVVDKEF